MSRGQKFEGQLDFSRVDPLIAAFENTQIICKGHPLIFLTPGWHSRLGQKQAL